MAEQIQKFRSALNGFNREDVVQFIQAITSRHETELNQLRDDKERLERSCRQQEEDTAMLRAEISRLQADLEDARAALAGLAAPPEENAPQCPDWNSEELAAYRRAEEFERQNRERMAQLTQEFTGLIADASVQMDEANGSLSEIISQLNTDFLRLRAAMDAGKAVLNDTAASLRATSFQSED